MTGRVGLRATALLVALAMFTGIVPGGFSARCAIAAEGEFIPPVDGPIVRRFEPPLGPYASGHRGIDFGVPSGTEVVASASGTVVFAGPVADDGLFVTIRHDDVLTTTYSFMSQVGVAAGQEVRGGDPIGLSGEGHPEGGGGALHFGVKVAGAYIDPEILLFGKLDDISNLISLGPIDDEFDGFDAEAARVGPPVEWGSAKPKSARVAEAKRPWHVKLGGAIAGAARTAKDAGVGAGRWLQGKAAAAGGWVKDKAIGAGRFVDKINRAVGFGIGSAFDGAGKVVKATGGAIASAFGVTKGFLVEVARGLGAALSKVGQALKNAAVWVGHGFKWLGGRLLDVFSGVRSLLRSVFRLSSNLVRSLLGTLVIVKDGLVFVGAMAKGFYDQIGCWREGGATPPDIPSKAEFARGVTPPRAPNDNIVVAVAGIGSHTAGRKGKIEAGASMYQMDFRTLGYSEDQIFHFSYRGIEERGGSGPYRIHAPYTKEDTYQSIRTAAHLLRQQLELIHQHFPGKKIDLVAHSQGGLVTQYYVTSLNRPQDPQSVQLDHMVTIASPHRGADAAQLHDALSDNLAGRLTLEELNVLAARLSLPPPSAESAQEMAEDSQLVLELNARWDPTSVKTTTIADTFDFVVTPQHTRLEGAANYTADMPSNAWKYPLSHHGEVVAARSTKEILYNALADTPSECTALRNAFADYGAGKVISRIEDTALLFLDAASESAPAIGQIP